MLTHPDKLHLVYVTSSPDRARRFLSVSLRTNWKLELARSRAEVDAMRGHQRLILTDERFEDGDWRDVLAAAHPGERVIVVADRMTVQLVQEACHSGAADVIDAHFDLRELIDSVRTHWRPVRSLAPVYAHV